MLKQFRKLDEVRERYRLLLTEREILKVALRDCPSSTLRQQATNLLEKTWTVPDARNTSRQVVAGLSFEEGNLANALELKQSQGTLTTEERNTLSTLLLKESSQSQSCSLQQCLPLLFFGSLGTSVITFLVGKWIDSYTPEEKTTIVTKTFGLVDYQNLVSQFIAMDKAFFTTPSQVQAEAVEEEAKRRLAEIDKQRTLKPDKATKLMFKGYLLSEHEQALDHLLTVDKLLFVAEENEKHLPNVAQAESRWQHKTQSRTLQESALLLVKYRDATIAQWTQQAFDNQIWKELAENNDKYFISPASSSLEDRLVQRKATVAREIQSTYAEVVTYQGKSVQAWSQTNKNEQEEARFTALLTFLENFPQGSLEVLAAHLLPAQLEVVRSTIEKWNQKELSQQKALESQRAQCQKALQGKVKTGEGAGILSAFANREKSDLLQQLQNLTAENARLNGQIDESSRTMSATVERIRASVASEWQRNYEEVSAHRDNLARLLTGAEHQLSACTAQNTALLVEVNELKQQQAQQVQQLKQQKQQVEELKQQDTKQQQQVEELKQKEAKLTELQEQSQQRIKTLSTQAETREATLAITTEQLQYWQALFSKFREFMSNPERGSCHHCMSLWCQQTSDEAEQKRCREWQQTVPNLADMTKSKKRSEKNREIAGTKAIRRKIDPRKTLETP